MDLGLKGRKAIVCAASQGLGKASAMALAREGVELVIVARRREILEGAADEIASVTANRPRTVIADVTSREGREAILSACPDPDILVNNTSHAVKAPVAMLALSNGARTGLTGFVAGLARSVAEHKVTVNNLLPGTFDTDRLKSNLAALARNSSRGVTDVTEDVRASNPSKRFGHPDEFGAICAFLCSKHAGYITGQNILIDGGAYPGTF